MFYCITISVFVPSNKYLPVWKVSPESKQFSDLKMNNQSRASLRNSLYISNSRQFPLTLALTSVIYTVNLRLAKSSRFWITYSVQTSYR